MARASGEAVAVAILAKAPLPGFAKTRLAAELGPEGAAVNYHVTATGLVADCSPAGADRIEACTSWRQAGKGLSWPPMSVTVDPVDGTVDAAGAEGGLFERLVNALAQPIPPGCVFIVAALGDELRLSCARIVRHQRGGVPS